MSHRLKRLAIPFAFCLCALAEPCAAQEFRIYTQVFDELDSKQPVVSRSLTIFHAGRVYDILVNGGEVVIFEPGKNQFILLNIDRNISTTVPLDQINKKLKEAYRLSEKFVKFHSGQRDKKSRHTGRMLEFQLRTDFKEEYNLEKQSLSLTRPSFNYRAKTHRLDSDEMAKAYRDYADWICRLNFVSQYSMVLPGPRLKLNESLFQRNLIPYEVNLEADIGSTHKLKLRAEHKIHWSLDAYDRNLITQWEARLKDKSLRIVSWKNYQQETLRANRK